MFRKNGLKTSWNFVMETKRGLKRKHEPKQDEVVDSGVDWSAYKEWEIAKFVQVKGNITALSFAGCKPSEATRCGPALEFVRCKFSQFPRREPEKLRLWILEERENAPARRCALAMLEPFFCLDVANIVRGFFVFEDIDMGPLLRASKIQCLDG
jgi:hypothetical protein